MSSFITKQDGYYELGSMGYVACVVILVLAILLIAFLADKKQEGKKFSIRQVAFSGLALALGFVASYIKIYDPPFGGSVTLFSMLFVCLIGYWYGIRVGLFAAFAYSLLQFIQGGGSYMLSPFQICCDYLFAFTALGLSGLFKEKKNGLLIGYLVSVFVRGLFHSIGGYLYWMDYMPENFPTSLAVIYPIVYNYTYLILEAVISVIFISIPPVKKAIAHITQMACD